jgi:hypothetical protein
MKEAAYKTLHMFRAAFPVIIGVLLLISLLNPLLEKFYPQIFTGNYFIDPVFGAIAGSISFGIPVASYILGGELLKKGVSLLAVAAFLLSWSSVSIAMLPLEISCLGKKFAILRNCWNFFTSIIIAILTIATLKIIQ